MLVEIDSIIYFVDSLFFHTMYAKYIAEQYLNSGNLFCYSNQETFIV